MKKLIFLFLIVIGLCAFQSAPVITIFMIGDSTMANKDLTGGNTERGWGEMLPGFFSEHIVVDNHAMNGRSSRSFINEGRWDVVLSKIKKGDYVFIQFGHNDEKPDTARHTDPETTFRNNLKRFVNETRDKGGIPVLFNSIARRNFVNDHLEDTHGRYREVPAEVAKELNAPFVDANKITSDWLKELGDIPSRNYFMWIEPNTLACCPQGRKDNTHLNIQGARKIAGMFANAICVKVPALASELCHYDYVVAKDGSGDFFTVQEAVNAVPDFRKAKRTTILVRSGEYKEKLIVPESKIKISLIGEDGAVITNDGYADDINIYGEPMSTSGSATCYLFSPDFYAENITFQNSAGKVGQAVAAFVSGDRMMFKHCRFLGFQDTLYTYGKDSRQYYEDCYIEGTVDFIFGWSEAVFNRCELRSKGSGYITAPSTDQGKKYGYIFYDCNLTADPGVDHVCLGRPWRLYAKSVYIRCNMGAHIEMLGWNGWGKPEAEKKCFFAEYQSSGVGGKKDSRISWSHQLSEKDYIRNYDINVVLLGDDNWNPSVKGNETPIIIR
jgi:pectinesterase